MEFIQINRPEGRNPSKSGDSNVDNSPSMPERTAQIVLNSKTISEQLMSFLKRSVQNGMFVFLYPYAPDYSDAVRITNFGYCLMIYATTTGVFRYMILSHFEGDEAPVTEEICSVSSINEIERYWNLVWEKQSKL